MGVAPRASAEAGPQALFWTLSSAPAHCWPSPRWVVSPPYLIKLTSPGPISSVRTGSATRARLSASSKVQDDARGAPRRSRSTCATTTRSTARCSSWRHDPRVTAVGPLPAGPTALTRCPTVHRVGRPHVAGGAEAVSYPTSRPALTAGRPGRFRGKARDDRPVAGVGPERSPLRELAQLRLRLTSPSWSLGWGR